MKLAWNGRDKRNSCSRNSSNTLTTTTSTTTTTTTTTVPYGLCCLAHFLLHITITTTTTILIITSSAIIMAKNMKQTFLWQASLLRLDRCWVCGWVGAVRPSAHLASPCPHQVPFPNNFFRLILIAIQGWANVRWWRELKENWKCVRVCVCVCVCVRVCVCVELYWIELFYYIVKSFT